MASIGRLDPGPNRFDARAALDDYKAIEKRKSFKAARVAVPAITTWMPCIARACLRMVRGCASACLKLARACDWWLKLRAFTVPDEHSVHGSDRHRTVWYLVQETDEDESVIDYERYEQR